MFYGFAYVYRWRVHAAQVVKARGENMAAAAAIGKPHGMLSVIGLSDADLDTICADVRKAMGPDCICQLANYLFPQVRLGPYRVCCVRF